MSERYNMCKDQPAQIDCRREHCKWHKNASCTNVSPAITLQHEKFTCWSFSEEEVYIVNGCWEKYTPVDFVSYEDSTAREFERFRGTKEECENYIRDNKPQYSYKDFCQFLDQSSAYNPDSGFVISSKTAYGLKKLFRENN